MRNSLLRRALWWSLVVLTIGFVLVIWTKPVGNDMWGREQPEVALKFHNIDAPASYPQHIPAQSFKTTSPLIACGEDIPKGWALYEIQAGDNLSNLAERTSTTFDKIMHVNCLDSETANTIVIGSKLYLPVTE